jgi:integrase
VKPDEILTAYETYLRSWQARPATVAARVVLARSRLKAWGLDGFTVANIERFLSEDAKGRERKRWTVATYHNHLTDFCAFLVAAELIADNPMDAVKRVKRPVKRPRPLTEAEVARVLSVVEGDVRDWILIALVTGLRAFEIAKLRGEDFTDEGLYVLGKGGVEATLPIHPELEEIRGRYPSRGYWFPGPEDGHVRARQISLTVGRLFTSLGIEGSIHRIRHVYGTRLLRKGANIRVAQRLMRHSSLETTAGYLAVVTDEEREAILLLDAG